MLSPSSRSTWNSYLPAGQPWLGQLAGQPVFGQATTSSDSAGGMKNRPEPMPAAESPRRLTRRPRPTWSRAGPPSWLSDSTTDRSTETVAATPAPVTRKGRPRHRERDARAARLVDDGSRGRLSRLDSQPAVGRGDDRRAAGRDIELLLRHVSDRDSPGAVRIDRPHRRQVESGERRRRRRGRGRRRSRVVRSRRDRGQECARRARWDHQRCVCRARARLPRLPDGEREEQRDRHDHGDRRPQPAPSSDRGEIRRSGAERSLVGWDRVVGRAHGRRPLSPGRGGLPVSAGAATIAA